MSEGRPERQLREAEALVESTRKVAKGDERPNITMPKETALWLSTFVDWYVRRERQATLVPAYNWTPVAISMPIDAGKLRSELAPYKQAMIAGEEVPLCLQVIVADVERQLGWVGKWWVDAQNASPTPSAAPEQPLPGPQAPTSAAP